MLGGPEARPELPTLLDAWAVEEELRDRAAERSAGPPGKVTCKYTVVKMEPGPLMGKARAIADDVRLGAGGVTAKGARCEVVGKSHGSDGLIFPVPPEVP